MATSFGSEEFIIDANKKSLVERNTRKIGRLFEVKIAFDAIFIEGKDKRQWLVVSGTKDNRSSAKNYILAICHPEQTTQVCCQGRPHLDDLVLENVERKTSAYLLPTGSQSLQVMGSELACMLAISQLELTYHITVVSKEAMEGGDVSTNGTQPTRLAEQRMMSNPSPTDVVQRVEGLFVDSALPEHPDSIDDDQLFASGADIPELPTKLGHERSQRFPISSQSHPFPQTSGCAFSSQPFTVNSGAHSSQISGQQGSHTVTKLPLKGTGGMPEVDQARGGDEEQSGMTAEGPAPDPKAQIASMLSLGQGMGYSQEEIEETLCFFDFTQCSVRPAEFLRILDKVRANKHKERNRDESLSPSKLVRGLASRSEDAGPTTWSAAQSKKASGQGGKKLRKGKQQGDAREHSASPSKPKAASSLRSHPGNSNSSTNTSSRSATVSRDDSVCKGKWQGNAPKHSATPSKPKAAATPWKSSHVTDPSWSGPGCSKSPVDAGRQSLSKDDSVIFMGEDLDDSVCLVDANTMGAGAAEQLKVTPPDRQSSVAPAAKSGCKRKEYSGSEDDDQTAVLKPYPSRAPSDISASYGAREQASNRPFDVRTTGNANRSAGASTNTGAAAANSDLRFIVIDGQNVAMAHGNDKVFSCKGIKLCVDYFLQRGHRVKAWVPLTMTYVKQTGRHQPVVDQYILKELKDQGHLGYTPARTLNGRHIVSHDDYFILDHAMLEDAVVVTRDNFEDHVQDYKDIIENRLLSYVFTDDHFMLPRDPLGHHGPTLEEFLCKNPSKPFKHPAKGSTPATASSDARLAFGQPGKAFGRPHARPPQGDHTRGSAEHRPAVHGSHPAAPRASPHSQSGGQGLRPLLPSPPPRHPDVTRDLLEALKVVFPDASQEAKIQEVLTNHPADTDLNKLVNYCIGALNV